MKNWFFNDKIQNALKRFLAEHDDFDTEEAKKVTADLELLDKLIDINNLLL
mgnify:CR=1 FL=1